MRAKRHHWVVLTEPSAPGPATNTENTERVRAFVRSFVCLFVCLFPEPVTTEPVCVRCVNVNVNVS